MAKDEEAKVGGDTTKSAKVKRPKNACQRGCSSAQEKTRFVFERINHYMGTGFEKLGRFNARFPIPVIAVCLVVTVGLSFGLFAATFESRPEKLWVPPDMRTAVEKKFFADNYGPFYRVQQLFFTNRQREGDNVLTHAALLELLEIENHVWHMKVPYGDAHLNKTTMLRDLCYKPSPSFPCINQTVLHYWYNPSILAHDPDMIRADKDLFATVSTGRKDLYGSPILVDNVVSIVGNDTAHVKQALNVMILFENDASVLERAEAWEKEFIRYITAKSKSSSRISNIAFSSESSIQAELGRMISADVGIIIACYIITTVYVIISLGKMHYVRSKVFAGMCGVGTIILAITSGFGIGSLIGIGFTPLSAQVVPFLVLATGIDDMFIIVNGYYDVEDEEEAEAEEERKRKSKLASSSAPADNNAEEEAPSKEDCWKTIQRRMSKSLKHVGPSLTLSQGSNFVGMMVGSSTGMPAMIMFSYQAGIAVGMVLILELTMLDAICALDAYRVVRRRMDCLCCVNCSKTVAKQEARKRQRDLEAQLHKDSDDGTTAKKESALARFGKSLSSGRPLKAFMRMIADTLLSIPGRVIAIVLALALLGACLNGTIKTKMGLGVNDVVPTDSYLVMYNNNFSHYFPNLGAPCYLVFGKHDYPKAAVQLEIQRLTNEMKKSAWMQKSVLSWLDDFRFWCIQKNKFAGYATIPPTIPEDNFYPWLHEFLADNVSTLAPLGPSHVRDVQFGSDGLIRTSRLYGFFVGLPTTQNMVDAMRDIQRRTDSSFLVSDVPGEPFFSYSIFYIFFEEYTVLWSEIIQNIGTTALVVFVLCLIFLGSITGSFVVIILLIVMQIDILGLLYYWGVDLNPLVVVNLCMVTGVCVEFTPHIVWASMSRDLRGKSRFQRTKEAFIEMGPNVTGGALSTLLGIIILCFASYPVFREVFFRLYFVSLIIAYLHSVILLPVLLTWMAPKPYVPREELERELKALEEEEAKGKPAGVPMEVVVANAYSTSVSPQPSTASPQFEKLQEPAQKQPGPTVPSPITTPIEGATPAPSSDNSAAPVSAAAQNATAAATATADAPSSAAAHRTDESASDSASTKSGSSSGSDSGSAQSGSGSSSSGSVSHGSEANEGAAQ